MGTDRFGTAKLVKTKLFQGIIFENWSFSWKKTSENELTAVF